MTKWRPAILASALIGSFAVFSPSAAEHPFNWTGLYIGANTGVAIGEFSNSLSIVDNITNNYFFPAAIPGVNAAGSADLRSHKFIGGGQIGYNVQSGRWVWGIEVDFNSIRLKKNYGNGSIGADNFVYTTNGSPYQLAESASANWLLTVRPRIGWLVNDRTMLYTTGGVAITKLEFDQFFAEVPFTPTPEIASLSKTKLGWTLGAGFAVALTSNWVVKGEYLFTHFSAENAAGTLANANGVSALPGFVDGATFNNSLKLDIHMLRAGINYKF